MSTEAVKSKLTFAKVAASANPGPTNTASRPSTTAPPVAVPYSVKLKETPGVQDEPSGSGKEVQSNNIDLEKFTPRPAKSTLVQFGSFPGIEIDKGVTHPSGLPVKDGIPISEENVTKLPSVRPPDSTLSFDGKSATSGTTFPLDEKESLRPDDSASVNAHEDDDGRASTQPSSRMGSDPGARAFSEQLREISTMGPPSTRQPLNLAQQAPGNAAVPGLLFQPSPVALPPNFHAIGPSLGSPSSNVPYAPDEKLLEALNSVRDRVWVLKLEQDITDFVRDPIAQSFDLPNCNSFYRMLAHKMADYYLLGHTMNESLSGVRLYKTPNCRIPPRLSEVTDPSTAASTPPPSLPQMKILRRADVDTRPCSRDGAVDADSGSDVGKGKFPATREEREARYEAARLRILGSAKPSDDAVVPPPKESDSTSNSVVGKKKAKKQRSDSEDGFEARSAYSMYPHGGMGQPVPAGVMQSMHENTPLGFNVPAQHAAYGNHLGSAMGEHQWPGQPYAHGLPQTQPWTHAQYGGYDVAAHMQQMSFQHAGMMTYPLSGDMAANPNYGLLTQPQMPMSYQGVHPQYPGQYPVGFPAHGYGVPQYAYGMPGTGVGLNGQKQTHGPFLSGPQNRPFFNPQSQAFIPGQSSPPFAHAAHQQGLVSPAISNASASQATPQNLQRQQSSHSANGFQFTPSPHLQQQVTHPQYISPPNTQGLAHPLPQPVFPPTQQHSPAKTHREKPSLNKSPAQQQSTIAKFTNGASLPPKPPPPINDPNRGPPPQYYTQPYGGDPSRRQSPRF